MTGRFLVVEGIDGAGFVWLLNQRARVPDLAVLLDLPAEVVDGAEAPSEVASAIWRIVEAVL